MDVTSTADRKWSAGVLASRKLRRLSKRISVGGDVVWTGEDAGLSELQAREVAERTAKVRAAKLAAVRASATGCDEVPVAVLDRILPWGSDAAFDWPADRGLVTPAIVRQVRRARLDGQSNSQIGRRFGISRSMVSMIANRKSWAHVSDEQDEEGGRS
jgi:hypothetical protein